MSAEQGGGGRDNQAPGSHDSQEDPEGILDEFVGDEDDEGLEAETEALDTGVSGAASSSRVRGERMPKASASAADEGDDGADTPEHDDELDPDRAAGADDELEPAEDKRAGARGTVAAMVDDAKQRFAAGTLKDKLKYVGGGVLAVLVVVFMLRDALVGGSASQGEAGQQGEQASESRQADTGQGGGDTSQTNASSTEAASQQSGQSGSADTPSVDGDAATSADSDAGGGLVADGGGGQSGDDNAGGGTAAGQAGSEQAAYEDLGTQPAEPDEKLNPLVKRELREIRKTLEDKLVGYEKRIERMESKADQALAATRPLEQVTSKLEGIESSLEGLREQIQSLQQRQGALAQRLEKIKVERSAQRPELRLVGFAQPDCDGCKAHAIVYLNNKKRMLADGDNFRAFRVQVRQDRLVLAHDETGRTYSYFPKY